MAQHLTKHKVGEEDKSNGVQEDLAHASALESFLLQKKSDTVSDKTIL